jgi:predicted phosphodiesterase
MLTETRRRRCDGVVCGHIHKPEMREVDGVLYANDGDWVESLSALVEHHDGRLELLDWQHAETTTTWQINDQFVTPDETNIQIGASA